MGEWLFCPGGTALIVARHEVPLQFGHLQKVTSGNILPKGGLRTQPRVSTLGTATRAMRPEAEGATD
jgi:hypothetical protein